MVGWCAHCSARTWWRCVRPPPRAIFLENRCPYEVEMSRFHIPHFDHRANYLRDKAAIDAAIQGVLAAGNPIMGPQVAAFEREFARLCGTRHAVGVMSGTSAILLALRAIGVGPGDEVVTVANSDIPTTHAIMHTGAKPVYADIDPHTFNMSTASLAAAITPRTRAVMPVHLYGSPADMGPIVEIARASGARVVEDAALATGARYRGESVGSLGDVGAFSTAPGKILGGIGSGGMITTNDGEINQRLNRLRYYGRERSPYPDRKTESTTLPFMSTVEIGYNERLDTVDAAVLLLRLKRLQADLAVRRSHRERYAQHFRGTSVRMQEALPLSEPTWRVVVIRVAERDRVFADLCESGIEASLPYLPANHLDVSTQSLNYAKGDLPVTEAVCDTLIALPSHQFLSTDQIDKVAETVMRSVGQERVEDPEPRY